MVMLLLIVFGDKGLADLMLKQKKYDGLLKKNALITQQNSSLYRRIDRLKNDPEFMEHVARMELGMIGKNEVILRPQTSVIKQ